MVQAGGRPQRLALDAWPLAVALVLSAPLLVHGGYPLARDLVFVPHQPWTEATFGLGGASPRAVPLDAVVSLLTAHGLDGGLLARLAVPLVLATAGWGAHRLVGGLGPAARVTAGGFAVWNPYVVERLALGQWALLAAYAALPWLLLAAARVRRGDTWTDLAPVVAWLGLASLTPTGGLLGSAAVLVGGWSRRTPRDLALAGACLLLQLTWLAPSLLTTAALTSDPAGVAAFAADTEGPGGVLTAVLGLGGIWDSRSVPGSRLTWWGVATAVVVVGVLVAGARGLERTWGRGDLFRRAALAVGGLVLVLLPTVPLGADLVRWAVAEVPGAGLLRDSQKLLAPYVVLAVAACAATTEVAMRWVGARVAELATSTALLAALLPLLLLPDATRVVWPTLDPVSYPAGLSAAAARVGDSGTLVTLPWRSYRAFSWGHGLVSSDPAVRWFDTDVLTDDALVVGRTTVHGESERAAALGAALRRHPPAAALAAAGVRWALVYRDDPAADDLELAGLRLVHSDRYVALYVVPDVAPQTAGVATGTRWLVVATFVLALAAVLAAVVVSALTRGRARRRREFAAMGPARPPRC